jgi:hypothetical protein
MNLDAFDIRELDAASIACVFNHCHPPLAGEAVSRLHPSWLAFAWADGLERCSVSTRRSSAVHLSSSTPTLAELKGDRLVAQIGYSAVTDDGLM